MKTTEGAITAVPLQIAHARVLIALDGSPAALIALPVARILASQLGAELELLHVIGPEQRALPADSVRKRLHLESGSLAAISLNLRHDEAAAGIVHAGEDPTTAMVVLTTHGGKSMPGQETEGRLGHVAEAVLARATHPVCIIRPEAELARWGADQTPAGGASVPPLRRLLAPMDGSPLTARAVRALLPYTQQCEAELDLLFVVAAGRAGPNEPGSTGVPAYMDHAVHAWPAWARDVLAWVEAHGAADSPPMAASAASMRVFVAPEAMGDIGAAIVREARARRADALALVRSSHLEPGHGGVLRVVLAQTHCPVLVTMV